MKKFDHILAKSEKNGKVTIVQHLLDVSTIAVKVAEYLNLDKEIAFKGAILHDIGKVSTQFQKTISKGFVRPPGFVFRHEITSLFFISLINDKDKSAIIDMVVAHHKSIYNDASGMGIIDLIDTIDDCFERHAIDFELWVNDALAILNYFGFQVATISLESAKENFNEVAKYCEMKENGFSKWKGLLIAADHLASAMEMDLYKIKDRLFIKPDLQFYTRQNKLFPLSLISAKNECKHTIVTAPTGAGKTDFLLKRCHGRVFYTLPFQASINAMYERIKEDLKNTDCEIHLLHASSTLKVEGKGIEEKIMQRHIGASIKVLTPHQLASLVFATKGYEALIADLHDCDVILDEIHTYSDTIQAIVLKIVEILCSIGCRTHIGTATMPVVLYNRLIELLGGKRNVYEVSLSSNVVETFNRHKIHKVNTIEDLQEIIDKAIIDKQKILIVFNQVSRAQNLYEQLDDKHPNVPKMLIHSRFKRGDRSRLETELKDIYNNSSEACIVVSTQVVEVSLDISFDLMITEAAPIDSMIQRFGRINRKRTENTIGIFKPIYVLKPSDKEIDSLPYSFDIIQKSYDVLPNGKLLQENELQSLIDKVYPEIQFTDIDLNAVYTNGKWRIKELWHNPKSALFNSLEIESATCIEEIDQERYETLSFTDQSKLEIPVSYRSIAFRNLDKLKTGRKPYVIPSKAYNSELGFCTEYAKPEFYDVTLRFL